MGSATEKVLTALVNHHCTVDLNHSCAGRTLGTHIFVFEVFEVTCILCCGCFNKLQQTWWLRQQDFIRSLSWGQKQELSVPAGLCFFQASKEHPCWPLSASGVCSHCLACGCIFFYVSSWNHFLPLSVFVQAPSSMKDHSYLKNKKQNKHTNKEPWDDM